MALKIFINERAPELIALIWCITGTIKIDNFEKKFLSDVEYWSIDDYKKQWKEGFELLASRDISCVVLSVNDGPMVHWLVFYKKNNKIVIQTQLLIEELYDRYVGDNLITPENCYDFIPEYCTQYNGEGIEWIFSENKFEKNINVQITDRRPKIIHEMMSAQGVMQLRTTKKKLVIPTKHWSADDYERQWQEGIARIKKNDKSCIVTRVFPIRTIDWYVLYKQNGKIYAYRYFLVAEDYDEVIGNEKFTPENCYDFIPSFDEYQKIHAKEYAIKEWEIDLQDIYDAQIIFPE